MHRRGWARAAAAIAMPLAACGCFAYGSYQSARPVDPGKPRITFAGSRNDQHDFGDDVSWTLFEAMGRSALGRHADFGLRFSALQADRGVGYGGIATADVKVAEPTNHLAFSLPVQIALWSSESVSVAPGFIGTLPLGSRLEVNGAAKIFIFPAGFEFWSPAYNLGLGIYSQDRNSWVMRPEVGWLRLEHDPAAFQFGVALELPLNTSPHR